LLGERDGCSGDGDCQNDEKSEHPILLHPLDLGGWPDYGPTVGSHAILRAIPASFFSRDLYRDVARVWRGVGIAYLLLLTALLTVFVAVEMQIGLNHWVHSSGAKDFIEQVP